MSELKIDAQLRDVTGHKVKQLRRAGMVPVVIYGQDVQPVNAQVDMMALDRLLQTGGGTQLVEVTVGEAAAQNVLIREVQRHPIRRNPIHVDFYTVNMTQKQQVRVPVVSVGHLPGGAAGMVLIQAVSDVEIEALPADIPAHIEVDISVLDSPEAEPITVADLPAITGVSYLDDPTEAVFSLVASRTATEAVEEEVEDADVEPEVIGRGGENDDE